MKASSALFAFLAVPMLALAQPAGVAAPAANAAGPEITSGKPKFDFGNVDEGPDIIHKFVIHNRGKGVLKISNVSTSCGCTAAVITKFGASDQAATLPVEIPPGGKGVVKATYHTNGRPGHATKIITVTSNDTVHPSFQLQLDMTVVREVDTQPDRLYLYGLKHGDPHSSTIKVLGKPGKALQVLSATSANNVVTITSVAPYEDPQDHRTGATIQVDVPTTLPIGNFNDNILIKTNDPKKPDANVPVMGEIVGPVQYNPKSLNFAPHQEMPVTITFTATDPGKFVVRSVESLHHLVRPSIVKTTVNGMDQYALAVSVVKNVPKDSDGKDEVDVYTNNAEMPKITIDVQANK